MIATSPDYQVAIIAPVETAYFTAEFGFITPGAREGATVQSSDFQHLGAATLPQLNNGVRSMDALWYTSELNRNVLGSGFATIPQGTTMQTGAWSTIMSGTDGTFNPLPYVDYKLDGPYDMVGIQIMFDDAGQEWAAQFTLQYLGSGGAVLAQLLVSNDRPRVSFDFPCPAVYTVRIIVNVWNVSGRHAKIIQIVPGEFVDFGAEDDPFDAFKLSESVSIFDNAIAIPQMQIDFPDVADKYDIVNPQGIVWYLRQYMQINSSIGLQLPLGDVETVNTGAFFLRSFPQQTEEEKMSFICQPSAAFAGKNYVNTLSDAQQTAAQALASVCAQMGLREGYTLAPSLANISVNTYIGDKVSLISALQQLVIALGAVIVWARDGSFAVVPYSVPAPSFTVRLADQWSEPQITQIEALGGISFSGLQNYQKNTSSDPWNPTYELTSEQTQVYALAPGSDGTGRNIDITSCWIASPSVGLLNMIADWYARRLQISVDYRGRPEVQAGDVGYVECRWGFVPVYITDVEIDYDSNLLQGKLTGMGG